MKSMLVAGAAMFLVALAYAGPGELYRSAPDEEMTEAKLLDDVTCDNCQQKEDAIFDLGELRSEKAVIPLMGVLHADPDESTRVVAALALCRIGDARGTYAVKRAAIFDSSEKVRTLAAWFYNTYVQEGSFEFRSTAPPMARNN